MGRGGVMLVSEDLLWGAARLSVFPASVSVTGVAPRACQEHLDAHWYVAAVIDDRIATTAIARTLRGAKAAGRVLATVDVIQPTARREPSPMAWADLTIMDGGEFRRIWTSIRITAVEWSFLQLVHRVTVRLGASHRFSRAVITAVRRDKPFHTVEELATHEVCSARALYNDWRSLAMEGCQVGLHQLLLWIALLHLVAAKRSSVGWLRTSSRFHFARSTLQRFVDDQLQMGLAEVEGAGFVEAVSEFEKRVLQTIASPGDRRQPTIPQ